MFKAESAWAGNLLVSVTDGGPIKRRVLAPADELYEAVARAGLEFFEELQRLCPGTEFGHEEREILGLWLA